MAAIENYHRDFARAVVALAREHDMDRIRLEFQAGFNHPIASAYTGNVSMSWSSGRHGDHSNIKLEFQATEGLSEVDDSGKVTPTSHPAE